MRKNGDAYDVSLSKIQRYMSISIDTINLHFNVKPDYDQQQLQQLQEDLKNGQKELEKTRRVTPESHRAWHRVTLDILHHGIIYQNVVLKCFIRHSVYHRSDVFRIFDDVLYSTFITQLLSHKSTSCLGWLSQQHRDEVCPLPLSRLHGQAVLSGPNTYQRG